MNKYDQMMQYRTDGMEYALKIAKEQGIEALEKEVRFRNKTGISLRTGIQELNAASEKIKAMTLDTFAILTVACLNDEFDFGQKRCQRYLDRMNEKAECIIGDFATWEDYINTIKDELGLNLQIRWNN